MADNVSRITIKTPIEFFDELPDKVDTVIIGGGIIGIFSAPYLARKSQRVLVCENAGLPGTGTVKVVAGARFELATFRL